MTRFSSVAVVQEQPSLYGALGKDRAGAIVRDLDSRLEFVPKPSLASLVNWRGGLNEPIHRWFRYREGFSPQLITELKLGENLLDPFCGSGSIMIGAAKLGRRSVGIDVNPLAAFAARTKLSPLSCDELDRVSGFLDGFRCAARAAAAWPLPALEIAEKCFEPEILNSVMKLRAAIEAQDDANVRSFLFLAWLSVLQDVGSYFKEGNGIKYRNRKRLKTGYVVRREGDWQRERFGDDQQAFVHAHFRRQLELMLADTGEWQRGTWREQAIHEGDTLQVAESLERESFDSIIFSPPYANRFDYFESMKVELWFGNFVETYEDLRRLRKSSVRSHLGADLARNSAALPALERLIDCMDQTSSSWRMGVPRLLRGYFDDMFAALRECRRVLKPGGRCHVVVGNSAFAGVLIPTDSLIADLALAAGFKSVRVMPVRHLTVAPQQRATLNGLLPHMRESVVVAW